MATHPKGKGFVLAALKRMPPPHASRLSAVVVTSSSDQRIMANTPKLQRLYEFLKESRKRVPVQ